MNHHEEKYNKIVRELIKKSFPELKKSIIFINYIDSPYCKHNATVFEFFIFKWIIVFKKAKNYSKDALIGMFAHELSHLAIIKKRNFFQKIAYFWSWPFSKKKRAEFERKTDIEVVKKGYGKQRIELNKFSFKGKTKEQLGEIRKKGYLSNKEIRYHMKKLK